MDFETVVDELLHFANSLLFYLCPAYLGALASVGAKHMMKEDPNYKKNKWNLAPAIVVFLSALVPSILLASINPLLEKLISHTSLRIGMGFITGAVGDEILMVVTSIQNLTQAMKIVGKDIESVKQIADRAEQILDVTNKNKPENKPEEKTDTDSDDS